MATTKRRPAALATTGHVEHASKIRFVPPWIVAVSLPIVGCVAHRLWGKSLVSLGFVTFGLTIGTVIVAGVALIEASRARPRSELSRVVLMTHSVITVVLCGLSIIITLILGWGWPHFWEPDAWPSTYLIAGAVLACTWNVRRWDIFRHDDGKSTAGGGVWEKLKVERAKVIEASPARSEVHLKMGDGQSASDVQRALEEIASESPKRVIDGGVRAAPGKYVGDVELSMLHEDVLVKTHEWTGPANSGGSIGDGIQNIATAEDGKLLTIYPAGNYAKGIAPGHLAIGGAARSGKDVTLEAIVSEGGTLRDTVFCGADGAKGAQFLDDSIRPAYASFVYADTPQGNANCCKALVRGGERAVVARAARLGELGIKSWTPACYDDPRLKMPALFITVGEVGAVIAAVAAPLIKLANTGLSTGVFLILSSQRWAYETIPPALRGAFANTLQFGCQSGESQFLVDSSIRAAGCDPDEWFTKYPGRFLASVNGVPSNRHSIPHKGHIAPIELRARVLAAHAPIRAKLDQLTIDAMGDAYVPLSGNDGIRTAPLAPVKVTKITAPQNDEDVDDDEEEEAMPMPEVPEELEEMIKGVDPSQSLGPYRGPDIDMGTPLVPGERVLTPDEKTQHFSEMLDGFVLRRQLRITPAMMRAEWVARIGEGNELKKWLLHELVNDAIDNGKLSRVEGSQGVYEIQAPAVHANGRSAT